MPRKIRSSTSNREIARMQSERDKLQSRLIRLDERIQKKSKCKHSKIDPKDLERWLDELATLEGVSPLPSDFSRADLYLDRD